MSHWGWAAPVLFVAYGAAAALKWVAKRHGARWPNSIVLLAFAFAGHTAYLGVRWAAVGHPPLFGTFENTLAAAWSIALMILLADLRGARWRDVAWAAGVPWVLVLLAWGMRYPARLVPLTISERSIWVDIHVIFAWSAFDALVFAIGAAILSLVADVWPNHVRWLPERDRLDGWMFMGVTYAFIAASGLLATGAFYLVILFGTWFRWELVQVSSLILWLGLASVLHARLFFQWRGSRLAWAVAALLPAVLVSFWAWSVYSGTYHSFDIPLLRAGALQ